MLDKKIIDSIAHSVFASCKQDAMNASIVKAGLPDSYEDLPVYEQEIARKMMDKGYKYIVQIIDDEGLFGEPMYFKSANDVGPFLRSFPDYKHAKTLWNFAL